jgi:transposase-like protein
MWHVTNQKNGASALDLQRELGLSSYQTAWTWLHKLRRAMVRPDRDRLRGWVEVDETVLGGLEDRGTGRQTASTTLVVIAAEADGPDIGRIRMRMIADASAESLHAFVRDCIEPGSTIHTDSWRGYAGLETKGYQREITASRGRRKKASGLLPRVKQIASLLKQWRLGNHRGAVALQHLPYYLDEFTFRFNLRKSKSPGRLFFRLMQQAVSGPPVTYATMVAGSGPATQSVGRAKSEGYPPQS